MSLSLSPNQSPEGSLSSTRGGALPLLPAPLTPLEHTAGLGTRPCRLGDFGRVTSPFGALGLSFPRKDSSWVVGEMLSNLSRFEAPDSHFLHQGQIQFGDKGSENELPKPWAWQTS